MVQPPGIAEEMICARMRERSCMQDICGWKRAYIYPPTPASLQQERHDEMGKCLGRRMINSRVNTTSKKQFFIEGRTSQPHELRSKGSGETRLRRTMVPESSVLEREKTKSIQVCLRHHIDIF